MEPHLPKDEPYINNLILANLKVPMYKISASELDCKVTCVTSYLDHLFVGTIQNGLYIYRYQQGNLWLVYHICSTKPTDRNPDSHIKQGTSVYDITVTSQHLVYFKEENNKTYLCVHKTYDTLCGKLKPSRMLETKRRAPMVADSEIGLIVIAGAAWTSSWTSSGDSQSAQYDSDDIEENAVRVIDLTTFDTIKEFKATDNAVSLLRMQTTNDHTMLGVADTRTGLTVFDLRQPNEHSYEYLYKVPVDEIRNFQIVGKFVGVFHKFEPNITFWNLNEQKTILCINIQDQMRQLAEEFLEDEDDMGLYETEDDHVTSVCCAAAEDDIILMYGTRSGCVFGMSVSTRSKLFNIPCPYGSPEGLPIKMNVQGMAFLQGGKLAVSYEKQGLTVLDFGVQNPPDRPPTRHMKRPKTS